MREREGGKEDLAQAWFTPSLHTSLHRVTALERPSLTTPDLSSPSFFLALAALYLTSVGRLTI